MNYLSANNLELEKLMTSVVFNLITNIALLIMKNLPILLPSIFFSASAFYIPGLVPKSYTLNESLDVEIGSFMTSNGK